MTTTETTWAGRYHSFSAKRTGWRERDWTATTLDLLMIISWLAAAAYFLQVMVF